MRQAALVTDTEASGWDEPFLEEAVCATRTHLGILRPAPQPFTSAGLRLWVEGEILNADDLTSSARDDAGTDEGLPALLARICARGGNEGDRDALASLDGIYSAVVYDEARGVVHAIVDRLGMQFMHWTVVDGCFAWATSSPAFLALPCFAVRVPARRAAHFLGVGNPKLSDTWMDGVELVPPGDGAQLGLSGGLALATALLVVGSHQARRREDRSPGGGRRAWSSLSPLSGTALEGGRQGRPVTERRPRFPGDPGRRSQH